MLTPTPSHVDDARAELNGYYTKARNRLQSKFEAEIAYLTTQQTRSADERSTVHAALQNIRQRQADTERDLYAQQDLFIQLNGRLKPIVCRIRQEQLEHAPPTRERDAQLAQQNAEEVLDRFRTECRLRSAYKEIALEATIKDWERNADEYARRAEEVELEKTRIERRLEATEQQIDALKDNGITRNVSGFLFWTGSLSVAAGAALVSELLAKHGRFDSTIDQVVTNVRKLMLPHGAVSDIWGVLNGLIPVALLMGLLAVIAILLAWFSGQLLVAAERNRGRNKQSVKSRKRLGFRRFLTFGILSRSIASSVEVLNLRALLHNLPGLIILPLLACTVIALTPEEAHFKSTTVSVAIAFVLSFQALIALCATFVLRPFATSLLDRQNGAGRPIFTRVILISASVLGVAAVAFLGLVPEHSGPPDWAVTPISLFLVLGGFALAFSIVFRGIFQDHDFLAHRREWFRKQIAELRAKPTLEDEPESDAPDDDVKVWRNRMAEMDYRHYLDLYKTFYEDWGEIVANGAEARASRHETHNVSVFLRVHAFGAIGTQAQQRHYNTCVRRYNWESVESTVPRYL